MSILAERKFHNILIIKPSSLGDVVRTLPVLAGLHQRFADARISWLVRPDCAAVLRHNPDLDEIIEFDRHLYGRLLRHPRAAWQFLRFSVDLHSRGFDLVLDLQGLFRSGFLALCSGARVRLGFAHGRELAPCFYKHRVVIPAGREHIVASQWRFAEALGFGDLEKCFSIPVDAEAQAGAERLVPCARYMVVLIGGTSAAKRWPLSRFVELVDRVNECYHIPVVILGAGNEEVAVAEQVAEKAGGEMMNLAGKTSLAEAIEIIRGAGLVVGNDSGPLHVAAALGTPVVGLYGPTDPLVVGPWGQADGVVAAGGDSPRRGRYSERTEHAMSCISVEQVMEEVQAKLTNIDGCER